VELREDGLVSEYVEATRDDHPRAMDDNGRLGREGAIAPLAGTLRISIVVVSYNYAEYLVEAVESALAQTYPDTEVVVVDDGSTDASREILRAFGNRVRLVLKENGGETSAVNAGFSASRGDIVMFLDSDDVLDLRTAEAIAAAWRPSAAKAQFRLIEIDAEGRKRSNGPRLPARLLDEGD
jgi:glycosyltransferase involved in cell wall biosynthesis